jgi:hypothetical protein
MQSKEVNIRTFRNKQSPKVSLMFRLHRCYAGHFSLIHFHVMIVKHGIGPYMKNLVLRRIFGPERKEVTGQWSHI